jgi:hypothetical protein
MNSEVEVQIESLLDGARRATGVATAGQLTKR